MATYKQLKPSLLKWANVYQNNLYDFWELVSEAWLAIQKRPVKDVRHISIAVRRAMVDYMRDRDGGRNREYSESHGHHYPKVYSLSIPIYADDEGELLENIPVFRDISGIDSREIFDVLLKGFSRCERLILKARYFDGLTLAEISKAVGLTQSAISLIHKSLLIRIKAKMVDKGNHGRGTNKY